MGVVVGLWLASATPAAAQLLVIAASTTEEADDTRAAAAQLTAELVARGEHVMAGPRVIARFERSGSSASADLEPGELEALSACADEALLQVATGRYGASQRTVERCLEIGNRALSTLNRETRGARQLFDACLYMVRARLGLRDAGGARAEAARCRMLVPDLTPSEQQHPPEVVTLVEEVDRELAGSGSTLRVRAASGEPCRAFINGRRLGTTPLRLANLPPGSYRVQLECQVGVSRVHRAVVGGEVRDAVIDAALDAAIQTDDGIISLAYASESVHEGRRLDDALSVAGHLEPRALILVTRDGPAAVRLDWVDVAAGEALASAWLPYDGDEDRLADTTSVGPAVDALTAGRSLDFTGLNAVPRQRWHSPARRSEVVASGPETVELPPVVDDPADWRPWVGWPAAGLGALGFGLSVYFYVDLRRLAHRYWVAEPVDPDYLDRQRQFFEAENRHIVAAALSIPFTVTATALLAPEAEGVPWWAWASGVVGLGAVGLGAYYFAVDGTCAEEISGGCASVVKVYDLGWLPLAVAAPLLTLPVTYLLRGVFGPDTRAGLDVGEDHALLTISGELP